MDVNFIREVGLINWISRTIRRQIYKRLLKNEHFIILPSGEQFKLPKQSKFATEVFITNSDVDWGSEALLFKLLKKTGAFLDIGANIGYYSLYMLPKAKNVYCFEPDPRMLLLLEQSVKSKSDIYIIAKAIGKSKGRASFTLENSGEVSHLSTKLDDYKKKIEVEITTIDDFVQANNIIVEAIKIDIEGYDIDAIIGAFNTLISQRPIVLTESELNIELFEILTKAKYEVFAFVRKVDTREKSFKQIRSTLSQDYTTKMLFLLPEEFNKTLLKVD